MADPWLHPLDRARRVLTMRLQTLERTLPQDEAARERWEGWAEYIQVCDLVVRLIACLSEPAAPISRRELAHRFGKKTG